MKKRTLDWNSKSIQAIFWRAKWALLTLWKKQWKFKQIKSRTNSITLIRSCSLKLKVLKSRKIVSKSNHVKWLKNRFAWTRAWKSIDYVMLGTK